MPMVMTSDQSEWFRRMRHDWLRVMQPMKGYSISTLFPPVMQVPQAQLQNCKLLPNREEILQLLPRGSVGAELGTQEGLFAKKMLSVVRPARLHLFDIDDQPIRQQSADLLRRPDVELHVGDSSSLLATFSDQYFDWIYIDGDHSYEGVSRDIRVARSKVKPGGLLIFNDFTIWSPVECIDYGVAHAVCELAANSGFEFVYFALHPQFYNDVALRRPLKSDTEI